MLSNIEAKLRDAGLLPDLPLITGKLVPCKVEGGRTSKKGYYLLYCASDSAGNEIYVGAYGNHKTGEKGKLFSGDSQLSRRDREKINKEIKEAQQREEQRLARLALRAAEISRRVWETLKPAEHHAYLTRKKVGAYGVRLSKRGALVIPMRSGEVGGIVGLQIIYAVKPEKFDRDKTYWPKGLRKEGAYHVVGELDNPPVIAIAEGYATAATIFEVVGIPVVVAFDAGNLLPVAKAIRTQFTDAQIIIAADDDWKTKKPNGEPTNPGMIAASGAAGAVGGKVLYPKFALARGDKDTDWNDLFALQGPTAVRAQWDFLLNTQKRKAELAKSFYSDADKWRLGLRYQQNGALSGDSSNIALILQNDERWKGVIAYNEFAARIEKVKKPPYEPSAPGEWSDIDESKTEIWLIREYGLQPKTGALGRAIGVISNENQYHPVLNYLKGLKWDRRLRLDSWMHVYLGAELTDYCVKVARKWMIGAVARIFDPGCKNDNVMILEGLQGIGKSVLLKTLAVNPEWFSDTGFKLGDREGYMNIRGKWIMEMGELDSFNKAENTAAKLFFSGSQDTYRNPYDRYPRTVKRQCVFAGTTNEEAYLRDPTGNRRYWPVRCTFVDIEGLKEVLNQLWAEAVDAYLSGEPHWVLPDEQDLFSTQQSARSEQDVWQEEIEDYIAKNNAVERYRLSEIMKNALQMRIEQMKQPDQKRVIGILHRLGFVRKQVRDCGELKWMYVRDVTSVTSVTTDS